MNRVHIDCFTALDDLPKKLRGRELEAALEGLLRKTGRFSIFEIDDRLARALDSLKRQGRIRDAGGAYPWVAVEVLSPSDTSRHSGDGFPSVERLTSQ